MADQAATPVVETSIPATEHEKQDGSSGIGMDGTGVSGTSEFDKELEDRFEGLNLVGEEETDLDFSEEIDELIGDVRWLLIFRVHTTKPFSHAAMFKQMRNAWASA
jgi:hypothetical protein